MRFASIGSGSKGNATLVDVDDRLVMIDCGFSVRETIRRMQLLGVDPGQLDALLVTHEHSDHSSGVARLSRKYKVPVYMTHGTCSTGRFEGSHEFRLFNCEDHFSIGNLEVTAVAVPHDAIEPCQYRLSCAGKNLGLLTDLGSVTPHVVSSYRVCQALILEFNHDLDMLRSGPYPWPLKQRVASRHGHLSNREAAEGIPELDSSHLQWVVLYHLSRTNNLPALAVDSVGEALSREGSPAEICVTSQFEPSPWMEIAPR